MKSKLWTTIDLLRQIANEGDITKRTDRHTQADILEIVVRLDARLNDFLNRADVLLSQQAKHTR